LLSNLYTACKIEIAVQMYRVRQKNLMVFKSCYIGNRVGWGNANVASWFHAISVAMEQWTTQHRAFIVEAYFKNSDSAITTWLFCRYFNIPRHGRVLCRNTIKEWVQNFQENASALRRKPWGRIPTVRTPENVDMVRMATVKRPRHSVRRHSADIGLSDCSVRRILHKDLNFHFSYKIAIVQELIDRNMANCRISSEQFLEMLNDDGVISTLLMIDETHFHLSGYVNKQNYRYWAPENPQELHQRPLHNKRLTVWCGIASFGILGPYFFEDN